MLVSHKGQPLTIDDSDRLWLMRAVEAEGQPRAHVAQTLVNRWAWLLDRGVLTYPRLQDLVRAYSQAVNPEWFETGAKFRASILHVPPEEQRKQIERAMKRREHAARTVFSPQTIAAVDVALRGPIVIPPGTVHFAAQRNDPHWQALLTRAPTGPHENALYRAPDSHGYLYAFEQGGPRVWTLAQALESQSPIAGIVVAAMGLVGVFAFAKRRR